MVCCDVEPCSLNPGCFLSEAPDGETGTLIRSGVFLSVGKCHVKSEGRLTEFRNCLPEVRTSKEVAPLKNRRSLI